MVILVDTNVFIDYSEGEPYACRFFREAMEKGREIGIIPKVYFECKQMATEFYKIETILGELERYGILRKIVPNRQEEKYAILLNKKSRPLGKFLDDADRLLIAIGKSRNMSIFSKGRALCEIANLEQVFCL